MRQRSEQQAWVGRLVMAVAAGALLGAIALGVIITAFAHPREAQTVVPEVGGAPPRAGAPEASRSTCGPPPEDHDPPPVGSVAVGLEQNLTTMIAGREGVGTVALSLRWPERNASLDINGAQPMHAASSIKLPVLVAALQRVAGGHLPPDAPIADRPLRAHLEDMVRRSDNDATNAVIMHLGLLQPGVAIHEQLGLSQSTQLVRLMGDLESVQRGVDNMTTTADLADLLVKLKSYAYSPAGAAPTAGLTEEACRILRLPKEGSAGQYAAIQNGLPPEAQGDVASKSGYIPSWLQDTYGDAAGTYVDAAIIYGADGVSVDSTWWTLAIVINGCTDDEAALTLMQDLARECWNGLRHIAEAQQLDAGQNQAAG